jgi:threonine dehydratase
MSNIEMIEAAAARAEGVVRRTPLLSSPFLDEIAGRPVHVKCEALQHTGSFKFRGGWSALSALPENVRARGVLAFSSGNHAQGVARAAELHGVPATIIMPQDAPRLKIANTRAMGAEVVLYDRAGGEDRNEIGARLRDERGLTLIRPFDEPQVIAGQGTCGLEIAEQAAEIGITEATVLTCCGGGGLTSGIALALEARAPGMRVRPVEPEGFDDTARSLALGGIDAQQRPRGGFLRRHPDARAGGDDLRRHAAALRAGDRCGEERETRDAMRLAFERLKVVAEPGGAVALAAALFHGDALEDGPVIATISGGNVDRSVFAEVLAEG